MIEISNLRKHHSNEKRARLEVDIKFIDMGIDAPADTMWFEIDANYDRLLVDDTCDPFLLVPLYLAMNYKTDLRIRGNVSKRLYKNLTWYGQKILCDFSPNLSPVKIIVDGFTPTQAQGILIGAGISCGVDSLSTLYDHFLCEDDPDYRINALFYFDCGIFGEFGTRVYSELTESRNEPGRKVAAELKLPIYFLRSNLHAFRKVIDMNKLNFISVYSCALSLGNAVSKYYISSGTNYQEIKQFSDHYHNSDMSGFCESYLVTLIQTERTELIVDGCQYRRVDKLRNIAEWDIAKKYLNVCWRYTPDGSNCTLCPKCLRTLLPLEIMGKLDDYKNVFDLEKYRKVSLEYKVRCLHDYGEDPFETENVDFAKEHNFPMPERRDCYILDKRVVIFEDK